MPSEHSSGGTKSRGGITKTGNGHVRRVLVEAAWTYRHPARKTAVLQRRAERTPEVRSGASAADHQRIGEQSMNLQCVGSRGFSYSTFVYLPVDAASG